eukprot:11233967-Alexandrium_andersonii.AAC.1
MRTPPNSSRRARARIATPWLRRWARTRTFDAGRRHPSSAESALGNVTPATGRHGADAHARGGTGREAR